jgi:hypothetical protein
VGAGASRHPCMCAPHRAPRVGRQPQHHSHTGAAVGVGAVAGPTWVRWSCPRGRSASALAHWRAERGAGDLRELITPPNSPHPLPANVICRFIHAPRHPRLMLLRPSSISPTNIIITGQSV